MIPAFVRLDLASWLPRRQTLLPIAFVAVVGVILPVPGMAIVASAFVTTLLLSTPFLHDERGRLDTLYGILPVSRGTVVLGRTIAILLLNLIVASVATVTTYVVAAVRGSAVPIEFVLLAHAAAFGLVGLAMAIQLPVLFRIGYTRGRLVSYAPALLTAAVLWILQALGLVEGIDVNALPLGGLIAAGAALGVIGAVVGTVLATGMYRRRELR